MAYVNKYRKLLQIDINGIVVDEEEATFVVEYLKDLDPVRAARVIGKHPDEGAKFLARPHVRALINDVMKRRIDTAHINMDWLLEQLVENHYLAREDKNLGASNNALLTIGKLSTVDAFAADKLDVTNTDVADRLTRARNAKAMQKQKAASNMFDEIED